MQFFQRLGNNVNVQLVLHALMRERMFMDPKVSHQIMFRDHEGTDKPEIKKIHELKRTAIGVMQLVNGSKLGSVIMCRTLPGKKTTLGPEKDEWERYYVSFQAQQGCMLSCGDETIPVFSNEIVWADLKKELIVTNNSKDDCLLLEIGVRIDD